MRRDTTKGRCTSFVSTKIYTVYIVDKKISKLSQGLWRFGKILESILNGFNCEVSIKFPKHDERFIKI